ncbi:Cytochrome P450 family protein [Ceratobasidium theobromae]|uniref:Cytochrome P450 family protein n=1 Tax=Ceratobasidium theobromae TaxID=1582974 RepID=A0A5N5QFU0_9AGAM|nr:Cytochrome P450 family protein [Ceratobasidium theobromae]
MRSMMNVTDEPRAYRNWGKELGSDIISIGLPPSKIIIVLNSAEAADELLSKRSSIYSDRPQTPMISSDNLVGWGNNTGMIQYGERWRAQRRMTHEALHKKASEELWPIVIRESRHALQRILDNPDNFAKEIKRMAGASLLSAVYGYNVTSSEDSLVEVVETAVNGFSQAGTVSNFYVNMIPWLEYVPTWFPGAQWKRKANEWRAQTEEMLNVPYEWTKNQIAGGHAPPSMLTRLLAKYTKEESAEEKDRMRWATGTLFAVASALVFIMAMAMHPEIQAKAQAEVDGALNSIRLPEMADRDSLPYVECIVKEVFRWKAVVPLGVPHACIQDDIYKGYRIPKGAAMQVFRYLLKFYIIYKINLSIANLWAISNDETVYPDPEKFNPDRFLDPSVPEAPAFGFGRRSCPGIHHAAASLFIFASGLLSTFNIRPACDPEGKPIPLKGEMGNNLVVTQPLPFKCSITPRSKKHEQALREWVDVEAVPSALA